MICVIYYLTLAFLTVFFLLFLVFSLCDFLPNKNGLPIVLNLSDYNPKSSIGI